MYPRNKVYFEAGSVAKSHVTQMAGDPANAPFIFPLPNELFIPPDFHGLPLGKRAAHGPRSTCTFPTFRPGREGEGQGGFGWGDGLTFFAGLGIHTSAMPLLTIVPPMPGAERRFRPFVEAVKSFGWESEFVALEFPGAHPPFGSRTLFPQVERQTVGKVVLGFSLGALYAHLGAKQARHLILGSISPFFLEDDVEPQRWMISYREGNPATPADILVGAREDAQMHARAEAVRDFYTRSTYMAVPDAEHELWHPNYLQAVRTALARLE